MDSTTHWRLFPDPLSPAYTLELYPDPETLSVAQGIDLMEELILPFFRSWRRPAAKNLAFSIAGVIFHMLNLSTQLCYVTNFTEIILRDRVLRMSLEEFMAMRTKKEKSGTNLPTRELETLSSDPSLCHCTICQEDYKPKERVKTLPCCKR